MHKNIKLLINEKSIFYNMWIFPNLPQNVDKIPNSKGPGPRAPYQKGCDGPACCFLLHNVPPAPATNKQYQGVNK